DVQGASGKAEVWGMIAWIGGFLVDRRGGKGHAIAAISDQPIGVRLSFAWPARLSTVSSKAFLFLSTSFPGTSVNRNGRPMFVTGFWCMGHRIRNRNHR